MASQFSDGNLSGNKHERKGDKEKGGRKVDK